MKTSSAMTDNQRKKYKADFIARLEKVGSIAAAAEGAGLARQSIYNWRHEDAEFEKEIERVTEHKGKDLVDTIYTRSTELIASSKSHDVAVGFKGGELWMKHQGMLKDLHKIEHEGGMGIVVFGPDEVEAEDNGGDAD